MSKISPDDYKKMLEGVELQSVFLVEGSSFLNSSSPIPTELEIKLTDESEFEVKEESNIEILHSYELEAKKSGSKSRYIKMAAKFCVKVSSKQSFNKDFFEIYSKVSLPILTYPYFREFVNSSTGRMNIPPITLPFVRRSS